jgi:hypothetical protein
MDTPGNTFSASYPENFSGKIDVSALPIASSLPFNGIMEINKTASDCGAL